MSEHPNVPGYGAAARRYELAEDPRFDTVECPQCGGDGLIVADGPDDIDENCPLCEGRCEVSRDRARDYNRE